MTRDDDGGGRAGAPRVRCAAATARPPSRAGASSPEAGLRSRGRVAHHGGLAAEEVVARHYERRGVALVEARWRGEAGEIDLVLRDGAALVMVEVKQARDHDRAARALGPRQAERVLAAAAEYLGTQPGGQLTEMRIDLALVDRAGRVAIVENALGF